MSCHPSSVCSRSGDAGLAYGVASLCCVRVFLQRAPVWRGVQVFRESLADWIKHPHLRETLTGAIVRVALPTSTNPSGEGSMCRITDVVDGATYMCDSPRPPLWLADLC